MPAINFKKEFAEKVKDGSKRQTIRPVRKNPIKKGDTLYLYTGMRTKNCRKLKDVICKDVQKIKIHEVAIEIEDEQILPPFRNMIATNDGFECLADLVYFFRNQYGLPFEGVIIYW
jgi:hypothetical protein